MKVTVNIKAKHIELAKGMLMQAADTDEEVSMLNGTVEALRDKTVEVDLDFLKDKDNAKEVETLGLALAVAAISQELKPRSD